MAARRSAATVTRSSTTVRAPSVGFSWASSRATGRPPSSTRRSPAWAISSRSAAGLALPTRVRKQISAARPSPAASNRSKIVAAPARVTGWLHWRQNSSAARAYSARR